jgi:HEAT repeats
MVSKKVRHTHQPKAVKLYLNEEIPSQPKDRPSRTVRNTGMAGARLTVEELLSRHHGVTDEEIRKLGEAEQKILFRIITNPAERDYVYRREAVSALASLANQDALILLTAIASDKNEDPVIAGRSLDGLAKLGGSSACRLIVQLLEHSDEYVRNRALRALFKLKHPDSINALSRTAATHPSDWFRSRARDTLLEMGVSVKTRRQTVSRPKVRVQQESS